MADKPNNSGYPNIPEEQWNMPISFKTDGTTKASLREHLDPSIPTLTLANMNNEQLTDIVLARLKTQPNFQLAMLGGDIIDQHRAIEEVKNQTNKGINLIEIEQRLMYDLITRASKIEKI